MIGAIAKAIIGPALNKALNLIPDKNARQAAEEELHLKLTEGINEEVAQQLEINAVEAAHKSLFVAGWRPAIGWLCALGLGWSFIGYPVADSVLDILGKDILLPVVDEEHLWQLLTAMLGMGGLRTVEKLKRVARNR